MTRKILIICALAASFASLPSYGQEKDKKEMKEEKRVQRESLQDMDTDGDRKISMAEAENAKDGRPDLYENFTTIDTDRDSLLDRKELRIFIENKVAARRADTGSVEMEEIQENTIK